MESPQVQCIKGSESGGAKSRRRRVAERNGGEHDVQQVEGIVVLTFESIGELWIVENCE